jgi:excisionase family DNA binding protein
MPVSQQVSQKPRKYREIDNPFTRRVTGIPSPTGVKKYPEAPACADWFENDRRGAPVRCPSPLGGQSMRLLRIEESERQLGVSKSTIYRLIREGEFDVVKIGHSVRITEESLDAYITTHTTFGSAVSR